jgi:hypothetical protein
MFTAFGYFGDFLDLGTWRSNSHNIILTKPLLQRAVKTGRKYEEFSR